jgi:hypothetical protein
LAAAIVKATLHALRLSGRAPRVALILWIVWAVVVWNAVFDHVVEVAGRQYLRRAAQADGADGSYVAIDDWMRPAVTRGLWVASLAAVPIAVVGVIAVRVGVSSAARKLARADTRRASGRQK